MHPTSPVKLTVTVTLAFGFNQAMEFSAMAMLATVPDTGKVTEDMAQYSAATATSPSLVDMEELALVWDKAASRRLLPSRAAAAVPVVEPPDPVPVLVAVPARSDVLKSLCLKTGAC